MDHQLPMLMFSRYGLGSVQMIDLLCDLALSHLPISEYLPRKEFIRKLILSWIEIINFERHKSGWAELKHRGIINEKDYKNSVFT